jgi:hypothetical protein
MATGDDDNDVDGDGATGNEVNDDGGGATGDDNDDDDDDYGDDDDDGDGDVMMGSGAIRYKKLYYVGLIIK